MAWLTEFVNTSFTGPVWPSSVLILLLLAYSVLVFSGFADPEMKPVDFGGDGQTSFAGNAGSVGGATIRWMNLDRVPLIVWVVVFGFAWWVLSLVFWSEFDSRRYEPTFLVSCLLAVRNAVIAAGATKFLTWPMISWFEVSAPYNPEQLVGECCEIDTGEATPDFGRAKFKTDGAPLLLNVRTTGETLVKGQSAKIVDFDPELRIYTVQSTEYQP